MAGIYIHVPFCMSRCNYCDFYSTTDINILDGYLGVLKKEIELKQNYIKNEEIDTIYLGGGTPSILQPFQIEEIISYLNQFYKILNNSEITLEVNPEDLRKDYFKEIKSAGVNRISLGVQSFDDKILKFLGRRHNAKKTYECINAIIKNEIQNLSIDLIFGIPGSTLKSWESELNSAFNLPLNHLSVYGLTIEKGTVLYKLLQEGKIENVDEDVNWKQFKLAHYIAKAHNMEHYEISNYAETGFQSKHNSNYWNGVKYIGLGPSAHSFDGHSRQWNVANLENYIRLISSSQIFFETEILTETNKANEFLLTGLRTSKGIDFIEFRNKFGDKNYNNVFENFQKFILSGHAELLEKTGILTLKGLYISDRLITDLMI
jgi:oxygen-independent coproporphyrinogen III oxidase